jgi:hypothetical protein
VTAIQTRCRRRNGVPTAGGIQINIERKALPGANVDDWIKQPDWLEPHADTLRRFGLEPEPTPPTPPRDE